MSTHFADRASGFLRSLRLKGKSKEVLIWMKKGDRLKEYDSQRIFLHSSDMPKRASIKLTRLTVSSLIIRGLVHPVKENDGLSYELTEEGDLAANLLSNLY